MTWLFLGVKLASWGRSYLVKPGFTEGQHATTTTVAALIVVIVNEVQCRTGGNWSMQITVEIVPVLFHGTANFSALKSKNVTVSVTTSVQLSIQQGSFLHSILAVNITGLLRRHKNLFISQDPVVRQPTWLESHLLSGDFVNWIKIILCSDESHFQQCSKF